LGKGRKHPAPGEVQERPEKSGFLPCGQKLHWLPSPGRLEGWVGEGHGKPATIDFCLRICRALPGSRGPGCPTMWSFCSTGISPPWDIIETVDGRVDKFIGDGVMALFGDPQACIGLHVGPTRRSGAAGRRSSHRTGGRSAGDRNPLIMSWRLRARIVARLSPRRPCGHVGTPRAL